MKGVNKVIIVGHVGEDPTVRYTPAGAAITNISIATSDSWKDKNTGQKQEKTEWHRVVFFGKLAEIAGEYLRKGSQVYVEGKLKTDKYQDKNSGQDRYSTNIVVDSFSGVLQMLGSKDGNKGQNKNNNSNQSRHQNNQRQEQQRNNQPQQQQGDFDNSFDDDIPF